VKEGRGELLLSPCLLLLLFLLLLLLVQVVQVVLVVLVLKEGQQEMGGSDREAPLRGQRRRRSRPQTKSCV
jgi:hypothetical protein